MSYVTAFYTLKILSSNLADDEVYWIQHYVIKIVSELRQVGSFSGYSWSNETDLHYITGILLKVALSTKTITRA